MLDFGIGGSELLVVALVALMVIGPRELPKVLRALGKSLASVRGMASEFQGHLDAAMKDTGLNEIKQEVAGLKNIATTELSKQSENFLKAQAEVAKLMEDEKAEARQSEPAPAPAPAMLPPPPVAPVPEKTMEVAERPVKKTAKKPVKKIAKKPFKKAAAKAKPAKKAADK
jgi:sec-independent protein translocase protein TatB